MISGGYEAKVMKLKHSFSVHFVQLRLPLHLPILMFDLINLPK